MALLASLGLPAHGLVVARYETFAEGEPNPNANLINTTAPDGDRGWSNLADNRTGIYLGDQWFLTAVHATGVGAIEIGGGVFPAIAGSDYRVTNTGALDNQSDLLLFRVGVDTTTQLTPEELDSSIQRITIADSIPATNRDLTIFGQGRSRALNPNNTTNGQYYFNSSGSVVSNPSTYAGFLTSGSNETWQWGENRRSSGTVTLNAGAQVNDTRGFQVRFDSNGLLNEAQGAGGDSGGPVFWQDGEEWVLAGLSHVVFSASTTSSNGTLLSAFGAKTGISDLSNSNYRTQIETLRSNVLFSYEGDIDLDGVATGEIIGTTATGDLGILVDNWNTTFAEAGRESWVQGDLNQDARIDLADFVLMRSALGGSISSTAFAAALGVAAIPEPSTVALLFLGGAAAACRRRRLIGG